MIAGRSFELDSKKTAEQNLAMYQQTIKSFQESLSSQQSRAKKNDKRKVASASSDNWVKTGVLIAVIALTTMAALGVVAATGSGGILAVVPIAMIGLLITWAIYEIWPSRFPRPDNGT